VNVMCTMVGLELNLLNVSQVLYRYKREVDNVCDRSGIVSQMNNDDIFFS
jgi:hypothetical protein